MGIMGFTRGFNSNAVTTTRTRIKALLYPFLSRPFSESKLFNADDTVLPVLIVGAGPVGLVLSILLTKLGVKCTVLEKKMVFSEHPQAHFINNRSMEIFRKLDGLDEEIEKSQPPVDLWRKFVYCTSLSGSILGSVDHMQPQDFENAISPVSVAHFSQHKLTRILRKRLEDLNFSLQTSEALESLKQGSLRGREILMGHECVSFAATDHCITATISFLKDGKPMERNMRCNMLIGADGAGSTVRKIAGINMRGKKDLQSLVSVHFFSRDLGRYLLNDRPGMLFFIFNIEAIGVFVAHDLEQGEFVLQMPFYPPQQNLEDFTPLICKKLIVKLVGQELSDLDVIDIKPWVMHAEVSEKFISCDNRIFLVGDAAHRFPPAGGFGMNTGIQDAHNLAWKIAAFVKGIAKSSILYTYETERRPIAIFNTSLSVQNFKAAMSVPAALGLDPTVANSVHRVVNNVVGSILPSALQKAILDGIFTIGRSQVSESILNERNPLGSSRLGRLKHIFEEGKSLQLQFPAEDLGFRYLKGALVPDSDGAMDDNQGVPTGRRRDYVPSADPGSRLPHIYVRVLSNFSSMEVVSILDIVCGEKVEFLLIISPEEESYCLARAAFKVAEEFKACIKVCVIWADGGTINGIERGSKAAMAPWDNYIDVVEVPRRSSSSSSWWSTCKMSCRGAILVRPDQHIAWRVKFGVVGDPNFEMRRVLSAILGTRSTNI